MIPDAGPNDPVVDLHREVDREAGALDEAHRGRLRCGDGCSGCCVDDLTVFQVEADRIRRNHGPLLESGTPHPEGACAFLDAGGSCRVYDDRPYVCRTQGYPLRWLEEGEGGALVELRDICPINDGPEAGPPIESLPAGLCWTIGPVEGRLAALQRLDDEGGGRPPRVRLRDLFARPAGPGPDRPPGAG